MALKLLELATTGLMGENAGKIASLLGEERSTVTGSLGSVCASVLAGIINKASAADGGLDLLTKIRACGLTEIFSAHSARCFPEGNPRTNS